MSFEHLGLQAARVLFVSSAGGHLAELTRIASSTGFAPDSALVTFDSEQSRGVDWIEDVRYVPYVRPRDVAGTVRASRYFVKLLRSERWDAVVSTGAAIAIAALPVAAAFRVRGIYIESYARFLAPSTTGRILLRIPGRIELYAQHLEMSGSRWRYAGSVVDDLHPKTRLEHRGARRWFITLGTIEPYRFDTLIEAVLSAVTDDVEVVWQLGSTGRLDLPGRVHSHLDPASFHDEARAADVVISHAGVGTAIDLIEMGHRPIIVPRRAHRGEHVDDHQLQIAHDLSKRGLVLSCDVGELSGLLIDN